MTTSNIATLIDAFADLRARHLDPPARTPNRQHTTASTSRRSSWHPACRIRRYASVVDRWP